jgi:hypothetical protein
VSYSSATEAASAAQNGIIMTTPVWNGDSGPTTRRGHVDYGWISEAFDYFIEAMGVWVAFMLIVIVAGVFCRFCINSIFTVPDASMAHHARLPDGLQWLSFFQDTSMAEKLTWNVLTLFTGAFFGSNAFHMALLQVKGQRISYGDMFTGGHTFGQNFVFNLISYVGIFIGCVGLCFGIFVVQGLLLPGFALVADGENAIDACSRSVAAMKSDVANASLFSFCLIFVLLLCLLPCGLGLLAFGPIMYLISCLAYRDMIGFNS